MAMKKLMAIFLLVLTITSCTTSELFYASRTLDIASDMIDIALGPWYVPHVHYPPPPPPPPPHYHW